MSKSLVLRSPEVRALLETGRCEVVRAVTPGRTQAWLTTDTINSVGKITHSKDDWWAMAMPGYERTVHCGVEMDGGHNGSVRCPFGTVGEVRVVAGGGNKHARVAAVTAEQRDGQWCWVATLERAGEVS